MDSFEVLLKFVTDKDIQEHQYDNIIISSVNHSDIVNKVKDYDVYHIEIKKKRRGNSLFFCGLLLIRIVFCAKKNNPIRLAIFINIISRTKS